MGFAEFIDKIIGKCIILCSSQIESLVNINNGLKEYRFYLVSNKEIEAINSKVENMEKYKWKMEFRRIH